MLQTKDIATQVNSDTRDVATQVNSDTRPSVLSILHSDAQFSSFCGIPSMKGFYELVETIEQMLIKINYETNFQIDFAEVVCLCLMKLKTNLTFSFLAPFFDICISTCIKYFDIMVDILYLVLKPFIRWPDKLETERTRPKIFRKYPNVKIILDCSEVRIES